MNVATRVFVATFDFRDSTVTYRELKKVGSNVVDGGELIPVEDYENPFSESVFLNLATGEIVTPDLKAELEERLRLRLAHLNVVHPNFLLKEKHA